MEEVIIDNKQEYFNKNYPFDPTPDLSDSKRCINCDTIFTIEDYKVFKSKHGEEYICCPNAPKCSGTVIDWIRVDD